MQQQQATYSEVSAGLASLGESFAQLVLEVLAIADRVLDGGLDGLLELDGHGGDCLCRTGADVMEGRESDVCANGGSAERGGGWWIRGGWLAGGVVVVCTVVGVFVVLAAVGASQPRRGRRPSEH